MSRTIADRVRWDTLGDLFGDVHLQLSDGKDSCDWRTRVLFHEAEDETVVLGHVGFLTFFTATFHGESGTLELVPNATLPAR